MSNPLEYMTKYGDSLAEYFKREMGICSDRNKINIIFKDFNHFQTSIKMKMHPILEQNNEEEYIKPYIGKEIFYIGMTTQSEKFEADADITFVSKVVFLVYSIGNIIIRRNLVLIKNQYSPSGRITHNVFLCEAFMAYSIGESSKYHPLMKNGGYYPTILEFE